MNTLPEIKAEINRDYNRPFVGWDGELQITTASGIPRRLSPLEAALLSPRVQYRVTGFREDSA